MHLSLELIGSFFACMAQLYAQVQLTKGCSIGDTAQKSFTLEGLRRGAYHEVLGPWVKKILIGQGRLKLDSATMADLQHGATDLLTTSTFFKGNILFAGKARAPSPAARLVTDTESGAKPPPAGDQPTDDPLIEMMVRHIRNGYPLNKDHTTWIRTKYSCPLCFSNNHAFDRCRNAGRKWKISAATPGPGGKQSGRLADTQTNQATPPLPPPETVPTSTIPTEGTAEKGRVAAISRTNTGEEVESDADESDDVFTQFRYDSDPELLSALSQAVARKTANKQRVRFMDAPPIKTKTVARIPTNKHQWVDPTAQTVTRTTKWADMESNDLAKLAHSSSFYHARFTPTSCHDPTSSSSRDTMTVYPRTVCPDSGATSIMAPRRDMFVDYVDLRGKGLVVRLGDEDKTIPITGRGTLCINLQGHYVAYANALHVPNLTVILLSSRVHRRISPGCSFVADNSGCFLTYPNFTIDVDDAKDCTIPCGVVPPGCTFAFDSRLHTNRTSSNHDLRQCTDLHLAKAHKARLVALRKSQAHLDPNELLDPSSSTSTVKIKPPSSDPISNAPTWPVYFVPGSGTKTVKRISSYELKRLFGCRTLSDWRMLEKTGTGLKVYHESDPPLTIGDMATINQNKHGRLLMRPQKVLHTVGMDIGYGQGVSPGGHKYALTLVDLATRHTWVYGLKTKAADSIIDALWSFFIDAGGILSRIRCDFDSSFVKGKVYAFLRRKGVQVGASPPGRHSQNGAVERQWRTATSMARALLVEARMPQRYWFWAIRESVIRMNLLPCRPVSPDTTTTDPEANEFSSFSPHKMEHARAANPNRKPPAALTTPFELFYGIKPNYRTLFKWGCMGYYRRVRNSSGGRGQFDMHSSVGIAIGRSNHTNGMIFWDPVTQLMNVSADYKLDPDASIGTHFPSVIYD
jgi:hypothetical protein